MKRVEEFLAERHAAVATDLSSSSARRWHDRLNGPRDSIGRRIYTADIVEAIKQARHRRAHKKTSGR